MENAGARQCPVVLVVDDDSGVRHSLKFLLEIEGFVVHLYTDAQALLDDAALPRDGCLVVDYDARAERVGCPGTATRARHSDTRHPHDQLSESNGATAFFRDRNAYHLEAAARHCHHRRSARDLWSAGSIHILSPPSVLGLRSEEHLVTARPFPTRAGVTRWDPG